MFTGSIADAFIAASIQVLVERTVSYLLRKKHSHFDGLLTRLRTTATSLAAVLDHAETSDRRGVSEEWLDGVQEAVFDADDLLDEIETDHAIGLIGAEPRQAKRPRFFGLFSGSAGGGSDAERRVRRLVERLEEMVKMKEVVLPLREGIEERHPPRRRRLPSTSLVEESEVYGREEDKDAVVELLLEDGEKIGVVPIVGMGGVGKTTLAQAVFNDCRVEEHFQVKEWVCVSEHFDICRVTSAILEPGSSSSTSDLNSLQVRLREKLAGKKFLIVLDDVWNEDYLDWDLLSLPFRDGARGSKVVVSTRSERVASVVGTVPSHRLAGLPDEACVRLLAGHAGGDFSADPELERIGREIVRKCDGLPLAVKAVGGLLRSAADLCEWERVAESDLWELSGVRSSILPALRLSYHYLPPPLKRCFAYCSIFPKDHEFDRDELVLLWMAEDLLEHPPGQDRRRIEDVGAEHFDELVSRSFLQRTRNSGNNKPVFVMHDLLVDLAKSVSRKYCFLSETSGSFDEALIAKARHFAYVPKRHYPYERFGSVLEAARLRTFLPVESMFSCMNLSDEVVEDLFLKLRRLRVLSLSGYKNIARLPDSIGDLKHLRFLNLSSTSITSLSESATRLHNLQTLKLSGCSRLSDLPDDFHRLINLRHLDVTSSGLKRLPESLSCLSNLQTLKLSRCRSLTKLPEEFRRLVNLRRLEVEGSGLEGMPARICELKSLRTLSTFVVGNKTGAEIGELGGLNDLRGTLHIKNLQNVEKLDDALEARLRDKRFLDGLRFEWTGVSKQDQEVLDSLSPNTNLKKLEIVCYGDTELPSWLGHHSFCNVVEMCLSNCARCVALPPLGQLPSLKNLQIRGFDSVGRVGSEFYGENSPAQKPFSSLEVLDIKRMRKWKEWSTSDRDSEAFPKLRKLCIESCNSLTEALPTLLTALTELTVSMCDRLVPWLPAMPNITKIEIKMSQNLSRVMEPRALESFTRLQHLEISADSLSIRLDSLPASMKTLKILSYGDLEFRLRDSSDSLEELAIECSDEGCFAPGFTLGSFPNIRILRLGGCQNLAPLWPSSPGESALQSLSVLEVANCHGDAAALFPENAATPLKHLTSLAARNCERLRYLAGDLQALAPSLESLTVKNCPAMETLSRSGPLPGTVRWLTLENCDGIMASRREWNLRGLGRLTELTVGGCESDDMAAFPEEGLLPAAITELSIWYLECLETLDSRGLRRLQSLKQLLIYECPNLAAMTDAALPACLESLRINGCPLLQENCRKESGKYWDNISHVPWIYFDYKLVSL